MALGRQSDRHQLPLDLLRHGPLQGGAGRQCDDAPSLSWWLVYSWHGGDGPPLPFRTLAARGGQAGLGPAPELLAPAFWPLEPLRGKARALPRASLSGSFQVWTVSGHLALSWTATHSSTLRRGDLPKTSAARVGGALSQEVSPHLGGLGSGPPAQGRTETGPPLGIILRAHLDTEWHLDTELPNKRLWSPRMPHQNS